MAPIPKRLTGVLLAVLCASIVAVVTILRGGLTGAEAIEMFKIYAMLIGGVTGAYQGAQSITDSKKLKGVPHGN